MSGNLQAAPRFQVAEEGVDRSRNHVDVLGERDVQGKSQDDEQVNPPEYRLQDSGRAGRHSGGGEPTADSAADGHGGLRAMSAAGDVEGMYQQRGDHQAGGEADDDHGLALAGQVEAQAMRLGDPAAEQRPNQRGQHDDGEDIEVDAVHQDTGGGEDGLAQGMPDCPPEYEDQVGEAEGQEPPEDGGVSDAGQIDAAGTGVGASDALEHLALAQYDGGSANQAGQRTVEAGGRRALQHQAEHAVIDGVAGDGEGDGGKNVNAHPNGQDAKESIWGNHRQTCSGIAGIVPAGQCENWRLV